MDIKQLQKLHNKPRKKNDWWHQLNSLMKKDIQLFSSFGIKDKERFFAETGMLLNAGVDLQMSLQLAEKGTAKNLKLKSIYTTLLQQIEDGASLANSMKATKKFDDFDCYSIYIGENTGELKHIFIKLKDYYSRKISQRRKISGALAYPAIVLITTVLAVMFMLRFVVPMFANTLLQFGAELPAITRLVINLSNHAGKFFMIMLSTVLIGTLFLYKNKHKENVRKMMSSALLRIPIWGQLMRKVHLAQFAESMSLLMASKVTIYESLELTKQMIQFYPIQTALMKAKHGLIAGHSLYDCIKDEAIFDQKMVSLIKIGEEINQLGTIFSQLSVQLQQEIDYQSSVLITILEPLMIIFLALVIGIILIAMYLPMFKLGSVIN